MFCCFLYCLASILSADAFRSCCQYAVETETRSFDPHKVQKGDAIFVNTSALGFFFHKIFPEIEEPFILISSAGFGTIDTTYAPFLDDDKLGHWFGAHLTIKHPKATCIPLGASWISAHYATQTEQLFALLDVDSYFREKPFSVYINWSDDTHELRQTIRTHFANWPNALFTRRLPFPRYLKQLSQARFIISPRGMNIDCFRNWETLYAGSIPVVESLGIDPVFAYLPVLIVDDLSTVTEEGLQEAFRKKQREPLQLERLHFEYWLQLIEKERASIRK